MPFVSVTRLRLRSLRFAPAFAFHTFRATRQVRRAPGFLAGALLPDRAWAFWTLTLWDERQSMRAYMAAGAHRVAMRRLPSWCDEAATAHWEQDEAALPGWLEADRRLRAEGRPSAVHHPGPRHATLSHAPPDPTRGGPISPLRPGKGG